MFVAFKETDFQWICESSLSIRWEGRPPGQRPSLSHAAFRQKKNRFFGCATSLKHLWWFFAGGTTTPKTPTTKQRVSCVTWLATDSMVHWNAWLKEILPSPPLPDAVVRRASVVAMLKVTRIAPLHRRMPHLTWKDSSLLMDLLFGLGKRVFQLCKVRLGRLNPTCTFQCSG